jgi:hypothetical protein
MSAINYPKLRKALRQYYIYNYIVALFPGKYEKFSVQRLKSGEYIFSSEDNYPLIAILNLYGENQTYFLGSYCINTDYSKVDLNDFPANQRIATAEDDENLLIDILYAELEKNASRTEYILKKGKEMLKNVQEKKTN